MHETLRAYVWSAAKHPFSPLHIVHKSPRRTKSSALGDAGGKMDRRSFILGAGAAGAALSQSISVRAATTPAPPRRAGASSVYFDALCGIGGLDKAPDGTRRVGAELARAIQERRLDVLSQTINPVGNGPDRFRLAVEDISNVRSIIRNNPKWLAAIESVSDIHAAKAAGKLGILLNFQDTAPLEGDPDRVKTFAELGIKIMQLTYNKRNLAGDGCLEKANGGISDFGRQVIARINAANVVLDLSHAGQRTIAEGIEASKAPLVISHSGCRNLVDFPRNTYDAELRALAAKGGVFGVYLMPFLRPKGQAQAEDLLRHLDHAVNVCGEEHVGIGTDNPMLGYTIDDAARKQQREFFEQRSRLGIAAPGEAPDVFNLVEGYNSVDRFDRIAQDLRRRGWSSARIEKVLGGNFVRVLREVWKA